jgi:hypothetical protein
MSETKGQLERSEGCRGPEGLKGDRVALMWQKGEKWQRIIEGT